MPEILELAANDEVDIATCDMCAYGMRIRDGDGEALVRKTTKLMSNSPEILKRCSKRCTNSELGSSAHCKLSSSWPQGASPMNSWPQGACGS